MFDFFVLFWVLSGAAVSFVMYFVHRKGNLFVPPQSRMVAAHLAVKQFLGTLGGTWKTLPITVASTVAAFTGVMYFELVYSLYTMVALYVFALAVDIVTTVYLSAIKS